MLQNSWIFFIFLLLGCTIVLSLAEYWGYRWLLGRLSKHLFWTRSLVKGLHLPLISMIWVIAVRYVWLILSQSIPSLNNPTMLNDISLLQHLIILLLIAWWLLRFIHIVKANASTVTNETAPYANKTVVHLISRWAFILVIVFTVLAVMQVLGFPISGLLTLGGIGGAGLAFAGKDMLANFFGGLMLYLDRPFDKGDWIRSPEKTIEGTVEHIGWRCTLIRTFDKRPLYIPNGVFLTIMIENASRMSHRRIKKYVGIRYQDASKLAVITQAIETMLRQHDGIDDKQTLFVKLERFAPSSLDLLIYTFTKTRQWTEFQSIQQDVLLKTIEIIEQNGAECAFPSCTVYSPDPIHLTQELSQ